MKPQNIFVVIVAMSLFNGLASPWLAVAMMLAPIWIVSLFPGVAEFLNVSEFVFYFASIIVSTATLLLGGVPAALLERLAPSLRESTAAMLVWLGGVVFLSLPALAKIVPIG
jgi:hypothetical protein